MKWTKADIDRLKQSGKIRDYKEHIPETGNKVNGGRKVGKHFQQRSKAKDSFMWNLWYWCNEHAVILEEEFYFAKPQRNFKFDFCIPALMVAIEWEGGVMQNCPSHTSPKNVQRDIDKYNLAQQLGYKVLRFSAVNSKTLTVELNKLIA